MSNEVINAWGSICVAIVTMEVLYCVYWLVKGYIEERRAMSDALQGASEEQREVKCMTLWMARDEIDGELWGFDEKPEWSKQYEMWRVSRKHDGTKAYRLPSEWLPEVTPGSPVKVELKIIEK